MRRDPLPYFHPQLLEGEVAAVAASLRNGWLTSGPVVRDFEQAFADRASVQHAVALSSCTAALHVALSAMGVGAGDEVVMPALTFVAGAQCVRELGATPIFADVDERTLSVCVESIDAVRTPRTKVVITMPYAGRPLGIDEIVAYAHARGILVLEDAAHAAGMLDRGKWAGARSDAAAYSFYATKNMTTGEGGMLLTNSSSIAERARTLSLHGMSKDAWKRYTDAGSWRYDVLEPGFKYNLCDPLAALGLEQLRRLDAMQARRDEIAARYRTGIGQIYGVELPDLPYNENDRHSWCMFVILVNDQEASVSRDALIAMLAEARIGTSVHYIPTHVFSGYQSLSHGSLANTEAVWKRLISLPLYPAMTDRDVDDVLDALDGALTRGNVAVS